MLLDSNLDNIDSRSVSRRIQLSSEYVWCRPQSAELCRLLTMACRRGRVDAFVQSTDKNFMVMLRPGSWLGQGRPLSCIMDGPDERGGG